MSLTPLKSTTALVASLSLLLPHPALVTTAWAQEAELQCLDESDPPCPEGEPEAGSTPAERADFAAEQAAEDAAEAEAQAAEEAAAVEDEAQAAEEAASAEDEAQAAEDAATAEAEAQAAEDAATAEAEAQAAEDAAAAEAEAQAAEDAAAVEAEAQAAEEAAAAEAEAQAAEEAAAAEAEAQAAEEAAAAEAEAQAAEEAAAAEDEAQAAEEAAAAEDEAQAAEEAAAAEDEAQAAEDAAAAEDEAQAAEDAAAAEDEAQAAEEAAAAEEDAAAAETEAQAAEDAAEAEAQAEDDAAETEEQAAEDAPEAEALDDPTFAEDDEAPAAATPETTEAPEDVVEETLDAQSVRTSAEEFETAIDGTGGSGAQASGGSGGDGLSNIQKALLLGLGAVAVGAVLRNGDRVVSNTGDRVVVEGEQGFTVYKDDDALLRQPGANMRTETFFDGSSRTTLDRADGSRVETIRDARGRVLRRSAIYPDGTEYELFDDLEPVAAVDMRQFQDTRPDPRSLSVSQSELSGLRAALREGLAFDVDRTFSLRQIREIEQVRNLVPAIDLDTVTFASGSAAIPAAQARSLVQLGILIEELLLENPREVFLIEGHTDATGSDSLNLALSDRRAESVALALTESFRIPPENLIVQGYGESFLKVQTQAAEERNRRATVRRITPLLRQIAAN
jgi:outer membrane protein OmpA-like peptidoglycan-associated protein